MLLVGAHVGLTGYNRVWRAVDFVRSMLHFSALAVSQLMCNSRNT